MQESNEDILVSIIVPVYNVENCIIRCLKSLVSQSKKQIEIIIVDDCSPDDSAILADKYLSRFDITSQIIHHKTNRKLGAARNTGLKYARGEYVTFVDSDDWLSTDFCELMYDTAKKNHSDMVYACYQMIDEKMFPMRLGCCAFSEQTNADSRTLILNEHYAWGRLIRRTMLLENELWFPEDTMFEDIAICPLYSEYASAVSIQEEAVYYYFKRKDSETHSFTEEKIMQEIHCSHLFLTECQKRKLLEKYREIIFAKFFLCCCYYPYIHLSSIKNSGTGKCKVLVDDALLRYRKEFMANRYLGFLTEAGWMRELLPEYRLNQDIVQNYAEKLKETGRLAVFGLGKKSLEFLSLYTTIQTVIDFKGCVPFLETKYKVLFAEDGMKEIDTVVMVSPSFYLENCRKLYKIRKDVKCVNYGIEILLLIEKTD